MLTFTHLGLRLLLFLAPIVPGTFIPRWDTPDIYKQYTMTWTSAGLHFHCCRPQSQVLDLSTHIDHKMTSNL